MVKKLLTINNKKEKMDNKDISVSAIVMNNRNAYWQTYQEFEETFGVPLKEYFGKVTGFDIVGFDDKVIMPYDEENISMSEFIIDKYGQKSSDLINKILDLEMSGNGTERVLEAQHSW